MMHIIIGCKLYITMYTILKLIQILLRIIVDFILSTHNIIAPSNVSMPIKLKIQIYYWYKLFMLVWCVFWQVSKNM